MIGPVAGSGSVVVPGVASASGIEPATVVPRPGAESSATVPPTAVMRVATLRMPRWWPAADGSSAKPGPSSRTEKRRTPSTSANVIVIAAPGACLRALFTASRQQK